MATINAIGSNIPIAITQGGTNSTSFTTDGVLYYDGTKLASTSAGSSGQIFASGAGTNIPKYSFPALKLLNTQTASTSASLTFTSTYITSAYTSYLITFNNIIGATGGGLQMSFSTNNGSSYLNSGYIAGGAANNYSSINWASGVTASTTICPLSNAGAGFLIAGYTGFILIDIPQNAAVIYSGETVGSVNANLLNYVLVGVNTGTTTVNNIKFNLNTGANIASGTISLYGIGT